VSFAREGAKVLATDINAEAREVMVVLLRGESEVRRATVRLPEGSGHEVRL